MLRVKTDIREIKPPINVDHCRPDAALLQQLSYARGHEAFTGGIDPADPNEQGPLRRKRFPLLHDRRNHRSTIEHELQVRSVINAGPDLDAKRLPKQRSFRGMSTRRR